MKMKHLFLMMGLVVFLSACNNKKSEELAEAIKVQEAIDFTKVNPDTVQTITNTSDIAIVQKLFKNAKKMNGVVDVMEPQYRIQIDNHLYFLWLDLDNNTAIIMDEKDTHTIYKISDATKIINLIINN
ncbi:hypothetical protein [Viridibacillus arvi]|uniref:hypothetical protein n=1 Tax=Viridibacillus arvi TaxID=263475 RepID=UPI00381BD831